MDNIVYTTPKEQIEKLRRQNLIINDEDFAEIAIRQSGYSNIIKSYREPYVFSSENNKKSFRSDVTFERICSLYLLDKNLRNGVMAAMQDLEEHIKEAAADVIASSFGTHQDEYLKYKNYRNKKKRKHRFSLAGILETMHKTLDTNKDPIFHYKSVHGIVPPWILFKSIYFSTIVNFIGLFKVPEQNKLVRRLYDLDDLGISEDKGRMLMMDSLYTALDYRNTAAHGGRIYNHTADAKFRIDEIFGDSVNRSFLGFSQLLYSLSLLVYELPYERLSKILNEELTRHCNSYPEDVTYLGRILDIDITKRDLVYITPSSNKYHLDPHCSGIKNLQRIDLEDAEGQGLMPCRRCFGKTAR